MKNAVQRTTQDGVPDQRRLQQEIHRPIFSSRLMFLQHLNIRMRSLQYQWASPRPFYAMYIYPLVLSEMVSYG